MKKSKIEKEPSVLPKKIEDESSINMVNNYGTYEVQATADTNNQYPMIAQGYNEKQVKTDCINLVSEKHREKKAKK
ncbi:MAG: hypothetical protein II317_01980 [Clostridia bacterium]|nr:hypothetical protein [Clostridia bacterium]